MDYFDYASDESDSSCSVADVDYEECNDVMQNTQPLQATWRPTQSSNHGACSDLEYIAMSLQLENIETEGTDVILATTHENKESNTKKPNSLDDGISDGTSSDGEDSSIGNEPECSSRISTKDSINVEKQQISVEEGRSSIDNEVGIDIVDDSDDDSKPGLERELSRMTGLTEEEEEASSSGPPRTKNEVIDDENDENVLILNKEHLNKMGDVYVSEEDITVAVGIVLEKVTSERTIVVQSHATSSPLVEGSLLCSANRVIIGKVYEIFGPITTPFYLVKWKSPVPEVGSAVATKGGETKSKKNARKKTKRVMKTDNDNGNHDVSSGTSNDANMEKGDTDLPTEEVLVVAAQPLASQTTDFPCTALKGSDVESIQTSTDASQPMSTDEQTSSANPMLNTLSTVKTKEIYSDTHLGTAENHTRGPDPSANVVCSVGDTGDTAAVGAEVTTVADVDKAAAGAAAVLTAALTTLKKGDVVFAVEKFTTRLVPSAMHALKAASRGSDASNAYDEEPSEGELEYSDDEQETMAKQSLKQRKRQQQTGKSLTGGGFSLSLGTGTRGNYEAGRRGMGRGRGEAEGRHSNYGPSFGRSSEGRGPGRGYGGRQGAEQGRGQGRRGQDGGAAPISNRHHINSGRGYYTPLGPSPPPPLPTGSVPQSIATHSEGFYTYQTQQQQPPLPSAPSHHIPASQHFYSQQQQEQPTQQQQQQHQQIGNLYLSSHSVSQTSHAPVGFAYQQSKPQQGFHPPLPPVPVSVAVPVPPSMSSYNSAVFAPEIPAAMPWNGFDAGGAFQSPAVVIPPMEAAGGSYPLPQHSFPTGGFHVGNRNIDNSGSGNSGRRYMVQSQIPMQQQQQQQQPSALPQYKRKPIRLPPSHP